MFKNRPKPKRLMLPEYSFRDCTRADFDFYVYLHDLVLRDYIEPIWGWDVKERMKLIRKEFKPADIQILCHAGYAIGVLQVEPMAGEDGLFIRQIFLAPEYQNKGIGSAIIKDIIARAKAEHKELGLHVFKTNMRAMALYRRLGFALHEEARHGGGYYMRYRGDGHGV